MGRRRSRKKQGDDVVTQSDDPVEPYDICDGEAQSPPRLPGLIKIGKNADHLLDVVSAELLIEAEQRVHLGEPVHLALCGSDAIAKFLERMMYNPDMRRFPWEAMIIRPMSVVSSLHASALETATLRGPASWTCPDKI